MRSRTSNFPEDFKPEKATTYLLAFLDEAPFANYGQHWLDERKQGKKSFVCPRSLDGTSDCPLCDMLGDDPRAIAAFNVIVFEEVTKRRETTYEPSLKIWSTGPQLTGVLEAIGKDEKTKPLNDGYVTYSWRQTGSRRNQVAYSAHKIKDRDVEDDWKIEPLSDDEFAAFEKKAYDETAIRVPTYDELEEVANELL